MVVIGLIQARSAGDLSEQEGGQTHLPEQIKHELADSSGSQEALGPSSDITQLGELQTI